MHELESPVEPYLVRLTMAKEAEGSNGRDDSSWNEEVNRERLEAATTWTEVTAAAEWAWAFASLGLAKLDRGRERGRSFCLFMYLKIIVFYLFMYLK